MHLFLLKGLFVPFVFDTVLLVAYKLRIVTSPWRTGSLVICSALLYLDNFPRPEVCLVVNGEERNLMERDVRYVYVSPRHTHSIRGCQGKRRLWHKP